MLTVFLTALILGEDVYDLRSFICLPRYRTGQIFFCRHCRALIPAVYQPSSIMMFDLAKSDIGKSNRIYSEDEILVIQNVMRYAEQVLKERKLVAPSL